MFEKLEKMDPLAQSLRGPIAGVILVGMSNLGTSVVSVIETCSRFRMGHALGVSHALEIEQRYLDAIVDFQDVRPPDYASLQDEELDVLAKLFDLGQVFCAVLINEHGDVAGGRAYDRVEMTVLHKIRAEIAKHAESFVVNVARY